MSSSARPIATSSWATAIQSPTRRTRTTRWASKSSVSYRIPPEWRGRRLTLSSRIWSRNLWRDAGTFPIAGVSCAVHQGRAPLILLLLPNIADDPYFENHRIMETDYETYSITYICLAAGPQYSTGKRLLRESVIIYFPSKMFATRSHIDMNMQATGQPARMQSPLVIVSLECRGNSI